MPSRMTALRMIPAALLLAAATDIPVQAGFFRTAPTLPLPGALSRKTDSVSGDFNGDGRPDLAVSYWPSDSNAGFGMMVFLGTGPGTFGPPIPVSNPPMGMTQAVTADFNEDGHLDIAMTGQRVAAVLLGDGTGHLSGTALGGSEGGPSRFSGVAAIDVDGDGHQDFVSTVADMTLPIPPLLWVRRGNGAGGFGPSMQYPVGPSSAFEGQIASGDLNGDGHADVAVAESYGDVAVLLGDGGGGFGAPSLLATAPPGTGRPQNIACADLNGDGKADIAVANSFPASLELFFGNGSGGFGPTASLPATGTFGWTGSLLAADLDQDGRVDLALTGSGLWLYKGDGAGGFSVAARFGLDGHSGIADFDADGRPDLAAGRSILLNHGNWDFEGQRQYGAGQLLGDLVSGDLNHDGKLDLVTANRWSGDVTVLLGNGDGSFAPALSTPAGGQPIAVALADFDGNGHLDAAVADYNGASVRILLGDGSGALTYHSDFMEAAEPTDIAAGDLDGDGKADLVVSNYASSSARTYRGDGTGHFALLASYPLLDQPRTALIASVNADVRPDMLFGLALQGGTMENAVAVMLATGGGGFLPPEYVGGPANGYFQDVGSLAIADFNADGTPDLLAGGGGAVAVLLGDGTGHFIAPGFFRDSIAFGGAYTQRFAAAGDFNRDGILDFVTNDVALMVGRGDGTFAAFGDRIEVGEPGGSILSADFDGDGHEDVAVAMPQANGVTILLGKPAEPGADLGISATHSPDPAVPLSLFTTTWTVTNRGPLPAKQAVFKIDIPGGAPFVSSTPGSPTCVPHQNPTPPDDLLCTLGDLAPGASAVVTLVSSELQDSGSNLVFAAHAASDGFDPDPLNDQITYLVPVGLPWDTAVSLSDSADPVAPGQLFTYHVTVSNEGAGPAPANLVANTFPPQVEFVSADQPCQYAVSLNCNVPPLAPGATFEVNIEVLAGTFTSVHDLVTVSSLGEPPESTANNSADEETRGLLGIQRELAHGTALSESFPPGAPAERLYYVLQQPHASYEVVVDAPSGDVAGPGQTLSLQRLGVGLQPVQDAQAAGAGPSRTLHWENPLDQAVGFDVVRVRSTGCSTGCGPGDGYRIRAYETTGRLSRFNTSGTQTTILILENRTASPVQGHAWLWDEDGTLAGSVPFALAAHQSLNTNLATLVPGHKGSVSVSHDGPHGALGGKAVALEAATGFTFDTPLVTRPR